MIDHSSGHFCIAALLIRFPATLPSVDIVSKSQSPCIQSICRHVRITPTIAVPLFSQHKKAVLAMHQQNMVQAKQNLPILQLFGPPPRGLFPALPCWGPPIDPSSRDRLIPAGPEGLKLGAAALSPPLCPGTTPLPRPAGAPPRAAWYTPPRPRVAAPPRVGIPDALGMFEFADWGAYKLVSTHQSKYGYRNVR